MFDETKPENSMKPKFLVPVLSVVLVVTSLAFTPAVKDSDGNLINNPKSSIKKTVVLKSEVKEQLKNPEIVSDKAELKEIKKEVKGTKDASGDGKNQLTAVLLALFIGFLGIHRFYLGYIWQGVVQILTLGGLGVWSLIDLIRIITGDLKPKNGEYTKTL